MIQFTKTLAPLLLCLGFGLAALSPAKADAPSNHMPSAGLVVLPEPQLSLTDRNQADYAFGPANCLDTAQIDHRFTLRNETNTSLTITQLQPSCHCTAVIVDQIAGRKPTEAEAADPTLSPGDELVLKVTVQLARQPAGLLSQGVFIFALSHNGPIARLHLNALLTTGITVSPNALDFGSVKPGEVQSKKITVTFDDRLVASGTLPSIEVQCDPQHGSATDLPLKIVPETEAASPALAKSNPVMRVQSYVVTLRPTQNGDVVAHLFFTPVSRSEYKGSISYDTATDVFREMAVSVHAQVTPK